MKLLTIFLNILFFVPSVSLAVTFVVKNNVVNEPIETQEFEKIESTKRCQYFLKTSFENDNFGANGNDDGYTHGHLTSITRSCDSGRDISINLDSRLFTKSLGGYTLPTNEIIFLHLFEEENRVNIEYTDWRDFSKMYQTAGLTVGTRSRDKMRLAGLEQKLFHDTFGSFTLEDLGIQRKRPNSTTDESSASQTSSGDKSFEAYSLDIPEYDYWDENKDSEFFGGNIAVGKSYSLNGLRKICEKQCIDYFRTEAGVELVSLKKGSNIYIFSEIDKRMPHPLEAFSIVASIKAQKNEDIDGTYNESSLGLRFRAEKFQLHYVFKKRNLPEGWSQFIEYDDDDRIAYFGLEIPF